MTSKISVNEQKSMSFDSLFNNKSTLMPNIQSFSMLFTSIQHYMYRI